MLFTKQVFAKNNQIKTNKTKKIQNSESLSILNYCRLAVIELITYY